MPEVDPAFLVITDVLMEGMLGVLLFAGALHVDLQRLASDRWQAGLLAVFGTVQPAHWIRSVDDEVALV